MRVRIPRENPTHRQEFTELLLDPIQLPIDVVKALVVVVKALVVLTQPLIDLFLPSLNGLVVGVGLVHSLADDVSDGPIALTVATSRLEPSESATPVELLDWTF